MSRKILFTHVEAVTSDVVVAKVGPWAVDEAGSRAVCLCFRNWSCNDTRGSGGGLSPGQLPRAIQAFSRWSNRRGESTGLRWAASRRLARKRSREASPWVEGRGREAVLRYSHARPSTNQLTRHKYSLEPHRNIPHQTRGLLLLKAARGFYQLHLKLTHILTFGGTEYCNAVQCPSNARQTWYSARQLGCQRGPLNICLARSSKQLHLVYKSAAIFFVATLQHDSQAVFNPNIIWSILETDEDCQFEIWKLVYYNRFVCLLVRSGLRQDASVTDSTRPCPSCQSSNHPCHRQNMSDSSLRQMSWSYIDRSPWSWIASGPNLRVGSSIIFLSS